MYIDSIRTIILPNQLTKSCDDGYQLIVTLASKLGINTKVYEPEKFEIGDVPKDDLEFLRGIIYQVCTQEKCALHRKRSSFEEGRTLAEAAYVIGYYSSYKMSNFLVRDHRHFANNHGEMAMDNKTQIVPLKERLKRCFRGEATALADMCYTLMKKLGYQKIDDDRTLELRSKYTMSYGNYVNLHYKQRRVVRQTTRRKQQIEVSKVPSKPSNSSLLKKLELGALLSIHESTFKESSWMSNHTAWIRFVWSKDQDVHLAKLHELMTRRTLFLQQLGSLTTKRLQGVRKLQNNPSKRKADITPMELGTYLEHRQDLLGEFLREVLSLKTPELQEWISEVLGIEKEFKIISLADDQKSKLRSRLLEVIREDEIYNKHLDKAEKPDSDVKNTEGDEAESSTTSGQESPETKTKRLKSKVKGKHSGYAEATVTESESKDVKIYSSNRFQPLADS
jgi:hypothetical protein